MIKDMTVDNVLHALEIGVIFLGFLGTGLGGFKFLWTLDKRITEQRKAAEVQAKEYADALELTTSKLTSSLELRGQKIDHLSVDMSDVKEEIKKLNEVMVVQAQTHEMINSLRRDYDSLRQEIAGLKRGEGWVVPPPRVRGN